MSEQIEMFGAQRPRRPKRSRALPAGRVAAGDVEHELRIERAIAMAEELHPDHWPRWLAFAVDRVRAGDPWLDIPAGERHPFEPSVPVSTLYRSSSQMGGALLEAGWKPAAAGWRLGSLFSGGGLLDRGLMLGCPSLRPAWACEIDDFARRVYSRHFRGVPIHGDIQQLTRPEKIDVLAGGFPCDRISNANNTGAPRGFFGPSALWSEFDRLVGECDPAVACVENGGDWRLWVPAVRRSLWARGRASVCVRLSSAEFGAPHDRRRAFVFSTHAHGEAKRLGAIHGQVARLRTVAGAMWSGGRSPAMGWRMADGSPAWLDAGRRNRVIGEGVDQHTAIAVGLLIRWLLEGVPVDAPVEQVEPVEPVELVEPVVESVKPRRPRRRAPGRLMSFMLTPEQIVDGSKDVTRRVRWLDAKPGDRVQAVRKAQGRRRRDGSVEPLEVLCVIEIVDVRRERLDAITEDDVRREGFPGKSPAWFVAMFCREVGGGPDQIVTRIEFRKVPGG